MLVPPLILLIFYFCLQTLAIEDITNRKVLFGEFFTNKLIGHNLKCLGVPTRVETEEIAPNNNELLLFHEDGRIELIQ